MKVRFWDRLILFFGAVLCILAGAALFVAGLQIRGLMEVLPLWTRGVCIAAGLLLAAFGVYLIVMPGRLGPKRTEFVVQRTDTGELRIAVKAIENLVQKCIDLHEEIKANSLNIINSREGVVVDLRVSLADNISIPLSIASLQKQIKQYLIASSGIEVREVRVSVESTQEMQLTSDSAESAEPAGAAREKPPLHQRLFGAAEQPAIVPEPPREEDDEAFPGWKPETSPAQDAVEAPAPQDAAADPVMVSEADHGPGAEAEPAGEDVTAPETPVCPAGEAETEETIHE